MDQPTESLRFVHTADWQLGMTRHFLDADAQPRYTAARTDAIERIGRAARAFGAEFVLVCGDVFESNAVTPRVVGRALAAMAAVELPVYLLPGNHDPLDAGSVYTSRAFREAVPANVHILDRPGLHRVRPGVEIVAAPWFSKHPRTDLVAAALADLPAPDDGVVRVVAGHGAVDLLAGERRDPSQIAAAPLEQAVASGQVHYVALGDRHSTTAVSRSGAIQYSGTQEVTDFDESDPGNVLLVSVAADGAVVTTPEPVGSWTFREVNRFVDGDADLTLLDRQLSGATAKDRTVIRLGLTGRISPGGQARLDALLERHRADYASIRRHQPRTDLAVLADPADLESLQVSGFLRDAAAELAAMAGRTGPSTSGTLSAGTSAATAGAALALLHRLAGPSR